MLPKGSPAVPATHMELRTTESAKRPDSECIRGTDIPVCRRNDRGLTVSAASLCKKSKLQFTQRNAVCGGRSKPGGEMIVPAGRASGVYVHRDDRGGPNERRQIISRLTALRWDRLRRGRVAAAAPANMNTGRIAVPLCVMPAATATRPLWPTARLIVRLAATAAATMPCRRLCRIGAVYAARAGKRRHRLRSDRRRQQARERSRQSRGQIHKYVATYSDLLLSYHHLSV